jgi:hypothetical protein
VGSRLMQRLKDLMYAIQWAAFWALLLLWAAVFLVLFLREEKKSEYRSGDRVLYRRRHRQAG